MNEADTTWMVARSGKLAPDAVRSCRVVSWNTGQDGCRRPENRQIFASLGADIAVLQECSQGTLDKMRDLFSTRIFSNGGGDKARGIGVLSRDPWRPADHRRVGRHVLEVTFGDAQPFVLRGVWANKAPGEDASYNEVVLRALAESGAHATNNPVLTIGDFNTSRALDKDPLAAHSHHAINAKLEAEGSASIYHKVRRKRFGEEPHGTLIRSETEGDFHIDYAYVPLAWIAGGAQLSFGRADPWRTFSDHRPLVLDLFSLAPGA